MSDDEWGMVMPFVVCESQGGPYEDAAFVAGYECGSLDQLLLSERPRTHEVTVRTDSMQQIDLIAMRHGYILTSQDGDEQWTFVRLSRHGA